MPPKTRSRSSSRRASEGTSRAAKQEPEQLESESDSDGAQSGQVSEQVASEEESERDSGGDLELEHRGHEQQYAVTGAFQSAHEQEAERYISNCRKYAVAVDPGIVIALRTGWNRMQPSRHIFSEGSMLPLLGVLDHNTTVTHLNLSFSVSNIGSSNGNGNSNARALGLILRKNTTIRDLNMSSSGLDDVGLDEISAALKDNKFLEKVDLSGNYFSSTTSLSNAIRSNTALTHVDVSRNALSYQALSTLLCACNQSHTLQLDDKPQSADGSVISLRKLEVMVEGNYAFEEILNSTSHGIAFLFSVLGCIILMSEVMSDTNGKMHPNEGMSVHFWACAVYSFSLMFLFLCSSLYHSFFMLPMASRVLQILDHVGIYMLIAGSYTPFLLIGLHGQLSATVLLCAEWLAVFCGILFSAQADFNSETTTIIELVTFVAMGCSVAFIWPSMSASLSTAAIGLLVGGGAAYVVGIYFFIKGETKPIYHTVWHLFVILGAACHWFDVYLFVVNTRLGDVFQHCLLDLSDTIATGEIHSDHAAELLHLCIEGLNNESAH